MYLLNSEDHLICAVYVHRRKAGTSLVEINQGMSELLDNCVMHKIKG